MTKPNSSSNRARRAHYAVESVLSSLALALALPLIMGVRDCERVVVGEECDASVCGGSGGSAGGSAGGQAGGGAGSGTGDAGCDYGGEHYAVGASFPSEDGCNTCRCGKNGAVACTKRACADGCGGIAGVACPADQYCDYPPEAQCGAADQTGTCEDIPETCADIYDPVCGCDDQTYANACEAAGASVSVLHDGECDGGSGDQDCGGLLGLSCAADEYCNFPPDAQCGAADQTGTCAEIPDVCPAIYAPVCGCDDMTYGNDCEAAGAGVSVLHDGECDGGSGGQDCGGLLGLSCAAGEYCNFPQSAQCGAADQTGTCTVIPDACDLILDPVCGCDDMTYGNACEAAAASVSVAHTGECDAGGGGSGQTCGGIASLECPANEFCNYEESAGGQGCDGTISDAAGVCETQPQFCTQQYDPVCGCDRRTYGNACAAHAAGVSALHDGACTEIDCEYMGGHAVDGLGPAPVCPQGETDYGPIVYSNGMIAIEGTICCVP